MSSLDSLLYLVASMIGAVISFVGGMSALRAWGDSQIDGFGLLVFVVGFGIMIWGFARANYVGIPRCPTCLEAVQRGAMRCPHCTAPIERPLN